MSRKISGRNQRVDPRRGEPQPFYYADDFASQYSPDPNTVDQPFPVKNIDFTYNGAYSIYNWDAQQIVDFLQGNGIRGGVPIKETTVGFYTLMKRQVKGLYAKSFQLAYECAKKAERALQHELGDSSLAFIQFNYLDGAEGLLAGEKLLFDVKAMEMAYHDLNQREYELTKQVSLLQVDPLALLQLRVSAEDRRHLTSKLGKQRLTNFNIDSLPAEVCVME